MALKFMEGFEVDQTSVNLAAKWDQATGISTVRPGRLHGSALQLSNASGRLRTRSLGSPTSKVVLGFGFQEFQESGTGDGMQVRILNGVSDQLTLQFVRVSGSAFRVDVKRGATVLASTADFPTLNWHYFELEAIIATGTGGSFTLRRNEVSVATGASVNTADSGAANWDVVDFFASSVTGLPVLDDIYIADGLGGVADTFLGDSTIEGRLPTGDGATLDWTPSTGSTHFNLLADNDTGTRVTSNTAGHIDYLTFDSLSFITGTIHGVMVMSQVRLDVVGSRTFRNKALSVAATANGATQSVESTSYATLYDVFPQDPNVAAAWTPASVNAASFGFELVS